MEDVFLKKVVAFLKEKREANGLTQSDLALKVFGTRAQRSYICKLEASKKGITVTVLGRMLKELNADIDFIEY